MPGWDAEQYLKFTGERTRPAIDLAARIALEQPRSIIDLGCGPGNSTEILAARWPDAEITGLDCSPEMIETARAKHPDWRWMTGDIPQWAQEQGPSYDLVFSNAALQWVDDHSAIYPGLMQRVAAGGALAVQVPGNFDAPAHEIMREIEKSSAWRGRFREHVKEWHAHDPGFYYDAVAPHATRVDLWTTEYQHVMPSAEAIVEWYKGSGLRPFLQALETERDRAEFLEEYTERIRLEYPARANGMVLFPFKRIFVVGWR